MNPGTVYLSPTQDPCMTADRTVELSKLSPNSYGVYQIADV